MSRPATSQLQIFLIFLRLGCISFGGPVAHLGYFKNEFVNKRKWLNDSHYTELLGLCQFVPGPSSSQLGFAIGWNRGGLIGACMAWLGFTLPSALIMIGCAYGLFAVGDTANTFIGGLLIAAVAVVADATLDLGKKLCPDITRLSIAAVSTLLMLLFPGSLMQIGAIAVGAFIGNLFFYNKTTELVSHAAKLTAGKWIVSTALISYTALLAYCILVNSADQQSVYTVHYQAGALVFGGGHVVLPLLQNGMVPSILSESTFLAGYSAAQALPGPLFTFSSFLGTASGVTQPQFIGGLGTLVAVFLPGILLLVGMLPFWGKLRHKPWAQAGLTGANAAVVGLLLAALINPIWPHGIQTKADFFIVIIAFFTLYRLKTPAWLVVLCCGLAGIAIG